MLINSLRFKKYRLIKLFIENKLQSLVFQLKSIFIKFLFVLTLMEDDKQNLETTIERFNKEFQRMENNFEKLLKRYRKISDFINLQKYIF